MGKVCLFPKRYRMVHLQNFKHKSKTNGRESGFNTNPPEPEKHLGTKVFL